MVLWQLHEGEPQEDYDHKMEKIYSQDWENYATTDYADDTGDSWQELEWDYNQAEQDWWNYDDQFGTSGNCDTTHDISGINERLVIGHYEDKNQAYYYRNESNSARGSNHYNRYSTCSWRPNYSQQDL